MTSRRFSFGLFVIFCLTAAFIVALCCGCQPQRSFSDPSDEGSFRPPTLAASTPTITLIPTAPILRPTTIQNCSDQLTFLSDLTIPDNTVVAPSSTIDKRWEVKNSGTCNWDNRYRLRRTAGQEMNSLLEQALYPARSGSQAVIQVIFTAPSKAGTYLSSFQAFNPEGKAFGDPVFIEIVVK